MDVQYSIQKMVSEGTLSTIALGIQYLQRNDIYMRIAGEDTPQSGAPSGYTWSFIDNTTLKILPVVPNGVEVVVYRRTDVDTMYNIYSQNAQFDESTIDENNQQLLFIAQEYLEQGIPGAGISSLEYINTVGGINYYRFLLTDGSYTSAFGVPDGTDVLRQELNSPVGSSLIGGALYADIRSYTGTADRIYCLGNSNMFDGAHGWFERVSVHKPDDGGVYLVDSQGRTWERTHNEEVNPVWFGALPLGGGNSLPALTAASTFARNRGGFVPPIIRIPAGNYAIDGMWDIFDLAQATIIMDGPIFSGVGAGASDAVVRVNNASNLKITGSCTISANYLSSYESAFAVTASPGGLIKPDTGIVSHMDVFGMTCRETKRGFKLGRKDLDAQIAELQFHGCEAMFCPVAVYNGGSQTGATFNGCTLASAPGTFSLASKFRVFDMDGGFVQMCGGELINSGVPVGTVDHVAIDFKPAKSVTYSNPFGSIKLSGVHIELTSALFSVGSGATPGFLKSADANISVSNCGGFIEQPAAAAFGSVFEPTFVGKVSIDTSCNFYTTQTRTGLNIDATAAPGCKIEVGRTAFGAGFKDWMGGCVGGVLYHPLLPVALVTDTAQSFPASVQTVVKLVNQSGQSGMSRYGVYSPPTGEITIPPGCRNITVKFTAQGNGFTGDIFVRKNGAGVAQLGAVGSGGVVCLDFNAVSPVAGDKYTIIMQPTSGPITLNGAKMTVYMEF